MCQKFILEFTYFTHEKVLTVPNELVIVINKEDIEMIVIEILLMFLLKIRMKLKQNGFIGELKIFLTKTKNLSSLCVPISNVIPGISHGRRCYGNAIKHKHFT